MSPSGEEPITPMTGAPRIPRGRAALIVIGGLALAGALIGALWAWIAPPVHGAVALTRAGERIQAYLGNEADHFFVSAFLMLGLLGVLAVVSAVLVWQWRAHRGPVLAAALSIGSVAAAGSATGVGAVLVRLRYGVIDIAGAPITPEDRVHYVTAAPAVFFGQTPLQAATTILLPAAVAALVYSFIAVSTSRDDLGGWPAVDPPVQLPPAPFVPSS